MESRILEFGALLRHHGLRLSTAETLDALRALDETGLETRELVRNVLRTTMVKRSSDLPVFDELFESFFSGLDSFTTTDPDSDSLTLAEMNDKRDKIAPYAEVRRQNAAAMSRSGAEELASRGQRWL